MSLSDTLEELIVLQGQRKFYIAIMNKQTNAAGAFVRLQLGWHQGHEDAVGIKETAARIVAAGVSRKAYAKKDEAVALPLDASLAMVARGLEPFSEARHKVETDMRRAARKLPVSAWAAGVRGLGELALAVILSETGDLTNYANPAKVWKRLGLAPYNGHAMSTWRVQGGLVAEDWVKAGYSSRRRAEIFSCVGDPLFRHQTVITGPYRICYDARRARTAETHPEWSKGHSHNDALRIMTKSLVLDLWSEWRRARKLMTSMRMLPAASDVTTNLA